jgi:hypothetical protein
MRKLTLIFRLLQLKQPCLDFLWPFLDLCTSFISDADCGPWSGTDCATDVYKGRRATKLLVVGSESELDDEYFSLRLGR